MTRPQGLTMLEVLAIDPVGETYTFVETGSTFPTHIASGVLKRFLDKFEIVRCEFGDTLGEALKRGDLGVEEAHALRLPEEALKAPCIVGVWGDANIIIDGAHRIWRRWKRGDTNFLAYVIPEDAWRAFVVTDMPGDAEFWDTFNRTAEVRTPELEFLTALLRGIR